MDKLENKAFLNASFGIRYFEIRHILQDPCHNIKCQIDNGIKISLNMLCRLVMLTLKLFVLDFRAGESGLIDYSQNDKQSNFLCDFSRA